MLIFFVPKAKLRVMNTDELHYVFRVEDENGHGPYRGDRSVAEMIFAMAEPHPIYQIQPLPGEDGVLTNLFNHQSLGGACSEWFFGFQDVETYKGWFFNYAMRRLLFEHDFLLVKYQCAPDSVIHGEKQSIFRKDKAVVVGRYSCITKKNSL